MARIEVSVSLPARDELKLAIDAGDDGKIRSAKLEVKGCLELLRLADSWRSHLTGVLSEIALPEGTSHAAILLREVILKAQGRWKFPYTDEELCHCRGIATSRVDQAVIGGCHTVQAIRAATSANTSCGTCLPDVQAVLKYRLLNK